MSFLYYQKRNLLSIATIFMGLLLLLLLSFKAPTDPDLGWHLRVGEWILNHKNIPHTGIFNWPFSDYKFIDFNWLANLGMWFVYAKFGLLTLTLLFSFLSASLFFFIIKYLKFAQVPIIYNLFFFILSFPIWDNLFGVRVQILSWIYFTLLIYSHWINKKFQIYLPIIFLLWANTHGSFVFGLAIYFLLLIIEQVIYREKIHVFRNRIFIFLLSVLCTVITPYGIGIWLEILKQQLLSAPYDIISEWLSPNFHTQFGSYLLIYLSLLIIQFIFYKPNKYSLRLVILIITLWFALISVRHTPFFLITSIPILSKLLYEWLKIEKFKIILPIQCIIFILIILLNVGVGLSLRITVISSLNVLNIDNSRYQPRKIVEYLTKNPDLLKLKKYNDYNIGGYLIWNFPNTRWFADGRVASWKIPNHTGNEMLLLLFKDIQSANPKGLKYLENEKVTLVICSKNRTLAKVLRERADWQLLFDDNNYLLLNKR